MSVMCKECMAKQSAYNRFSLSRKGGMADSKVEYTMWPNLRANIVSGCENGSTNFQSMEEDRRELEHKKDNNKWRLLLQPLPL